MSILDINRAMAAYAQPTQFDQNAWKMAFDISNAFANTSETHRQNRENLATSDWRVAYQNNQFDNGIKQNDLKTAELQRLYDNNVKTDPSYIAATIAQNNYATTNYDLNRQGILGQDESLRFIRQYGKPGQSMMEIYNSVPEEVRNKLSPYAFGTFYQAGNQDRVNQQALQMGILNNSQEMTTDSLGNLVPTGRINTERFNQKLNEAVVTGQMTREQADDLKNRMFPVAPNQVVPIGMSNGSFSGRLAALQGNLPQTVQVPYALGQQPITPQSAVVNPTVSTPQVDYVKEYGLTENDLNLVNQYAQVKGISPDVALRELALSAYKYRQNGTFSPEETNRFLQTRLQREREVAKNRALIANAPIAQMQQQGYQILDDYGVGVNTGFFR